MMWRVAGSLTLWESRELFAAILVDAHKTSLERFQRKVGELFAHFDKEQSGRVAPSTCL